MRRTIVMIGRPALNSCNRSYRTARVCGWHATSGMSSIPGRRCSMYDVASDDEKRESKMKKGNDEARLCTHGRKRREDTEEMMNIRGTAETSKYMSKPLYYRSG